jgi:hypothetical protein
MSGGDPPEQVAVAGPALEPRCAFVDDVCCPGTLPLDAGVAD